TEAARRERLEGDGGLAAAAQAELGVERDGRSGHGEQLLEPRFFELGLAREEVEDPHPLVGDEALAGEQLARLLDRRVDRREHDVGRRELLVGNALAAAPDLVR